MKTAWYRNGLPFQCQKCGRCCSAYPGYVWLSKDDIKNIASFLHLSEETFLKKYTLVAPNKKISLKEQAGSYSCIFYENQRCQIYLARPVQCKTFPWWKSNLESFKEFEKLKEFCPGVQISEPVVSFEAIKKTLEEYLASCLLQKSCKD